MAFQAGKWIGRCCNLGKPSQFRNCETGMDMIFRRIAMIVDTDIQLSAAVTACPGVEVYHVATQDDIDIALLSNMETPCKLAFVGGDQAKTFAKSYGGTWIEDGPTVETDLLRFWGNVST